MQQPMQKGRGSRINASGRYEAWRRMAFDDGWAVEDDAPPRIRTEVTLETPRTIISYNTSPDISFDRAINTYRGCEHGCFYCYARPNHAYAGLSPGLDFETKLFAKVNAPQALERELRAKSYKPAMIMMGGVTDVYQPIERDYEITRGVLQVLRHFDHAVAVITKSQLIARDIDILAPMAAKRLAKVAISVTTLDSKLSRTMEPRAAAPHRRLETIRALSEAGVPVAVMVAPIIPALNDHEVEAILEAARDAGAVQAGYVLLRLPLEIKELARDWFAAHVPDRAKRIMSHVRTARGGKDYDATWGVRQHGEGAYAALIGQRFRRACAKLGLNAQRSALDASQFRRPSRPGDQLDLL
ncbi:MAG: PA0069 family radical SAM protein [Alphaproteobacteria bacterium]|nr:PA0069 family radical SAM protein [Alphaproteobacteria bacterium]